MARSRIYYSVALGMALAPCVASAGVFLGKRPLQPVANAVSVTLPSGSNWSLGVVALSANPPYALAGLRLAGPARTQGGVPIPATPTVTDLAAGLVEVQPGTVAVSSPPPGRGDLFVYLAVPPGTEVRVISSGHVVHNGAIYDSLFLQESGVAESGKIRSFSSFMVRVGRANLPPGSDYTLLKDGTVAVSERILKAHVRSAAVLPMPSRPGRPLTAVLAIRVSPAGSVSAVSRLTGDAGLAEAITPEILGWLFTPIQYGGAAVAVRGTVLVQADAQGNVRTSLSAQ